MVRAIGEVLRFQREGTVFAVATADADGGTVEEAGGVNLHPRLGGQTFQRAPAVGIVNARSKLGLRGVAVLVQHPVLVVAIRNGELLIFLPNARADCGRLAEVERGALHGRELSERDLAPVERQVLVRVNGENLPEHAAGRPGSSQVEVHVVRQIDHRVLVGHRRIVNGERAIIRQRVGDADLHLAGVAFLAIGAGVGQQRADALTGGRNRFHLPDPLVESSLAAVDCVRRIGKCELILVAVQLEATSGDPVSVPPDQRAEIELVSRARGLVVAERREAEHDGGETALPVRHDDIGDDAAVVHKCHAHAAAAGHGVSGDGLAVRRRAERRTGQRRGLGRRRGFVRRVERRTGQRRGLGRRHGFVRRLA